MKQTATQSIYTVNFHLVKNCNLRCKFCYAHFHNVRRKDLLSLEMLYSIIKKLKEAGCIKLNFAGGEPFLQPHLGELIQYAHSLKLKTSIVTNGTLLDKKWLDSYGVFLDWIAISCDSAKEDVQKELGRGKGEQVKQTFQAFELIKNFNETHDHQIRTKLNSVITKLNWQEDMSQFVLNSGIERWKIFQVLLINGENDVFYPSLAITREQFLSFVERHRHLQEKNIILAPEDNDAMTESYVMVDPQGRFFQNTDNVYKLSGSILDTGVEEALEQVGFSEEKFLSRGGFYDY